MYCRANNTFHIYQDWWNVLNSTLMINIWTISQKNMVWLPYGTHRDAIHPPQGTNKYAAITYLVCRRPQLPINQKMKSDEITVGGYKNPRQLSFKSLHRLRQTPNLTQRLTFRGICLIWQYKMTRYLVWYKIYPLLLMYNVYCYLSLVKCDKNDYINQSKE